MSAGAGIGSTTSNFISSLISNIAIAGGELAGFTLIRKWFAPIYEPRSYMPDKEFQAPALSQNLLMVYWQMIMADPKFVLEKNGVDAYVYLMYVRMCLEIFIPIWILSWAILLPLDAVGTRSGTNSGLDLLTLGNIGVDKQSRLWGHLVMAWVSTGWICYLIQREMRTWVTIRQRWLVSPRHSSLAQARTLLVTEIPKSYMDEERLAQLFSHLPGGVRRVWLTRNLKEMPDLYNDRVKATKKLENAQVKIIKLARKIKLDKEEAQSKAERKGKDLKPKFKAEINPTLGQGETSPSTQTLKDLGAPITFTDLALADQLVPRDQRPRHRLPRKKWILPIPFSGVKVDSIDWARKEIARTTQGLNEGRIRLAEDMAKPGIEGEMYPPGTAAFIQFEKQISAHMASEILLHDQPYAMGQAYTETSPDDIIWQNLSINAYEKNLRTAIGWAATGGIVLAYTFPSAFIGALSNVTSLCIQYPRLAALCTLNSAEKGILEGVVPPILSSLINLLIPNVLRQFGRLEGMPKKTALELSLMTRMIIFTIINTFLITTLSSGLISTIPKILKDPSSIATILATSLPLASTYFLTFTMTQAAGAAGSLLQPITLVVYCVKLILLGGTPRSVYGLRYQMQTTQWGTTFPATTLIVVITLSYSIISPIINGLAVAAFAVIYIAAKYTYIWTSNTPASAETGGLFFPKAVTHVFIGLYLGGICLCALFFLSRDANGNASCIPQGALIVVLLFFILAFQYTVINSFGPLKKALPLSLAYLSYGMGPEQGHEGSIAETLDGDHDPRRSTVGDPLLPPRISVSDEKERRSGEKLGPMDEDGAELSRRLSARSEVSEDMQREISGRTNASGLLPNPQQDEGLLRRRSSRQSDKRMSLPRPAQEPTDDVPQGEKRFSTQSALPEPHSAADDIELGDRKAQNENSSVQDGNSPSIDQRPEPTGQQYDQIDYDALTFVHPSAREPQRCVWLPADDLGVGEAEARDNRMVGIYSTTRGAMLNEEGKVDISEPPPDDYNPDVE